MVGGTGPQHRHSSARSIAHHRYVMNRRPSRNAAISLGLGLAVGIIGFALTSFDPLWEVLGVDPEIRAPLGIGLSLFVLLVGFLGALYFEQLAFYAGQVDFQAEVRRSIPTVTLFSVSTGDEAMKRVSGLLLSARSVRNTRVFQGHYVPPPHPRVSEWDAALRTAVHNGVTYREVVSVGNEALVLERQRAAAGGRGTYGAVVIDWPLPTFLNFVILELQDGTRELWFGWLISPHVGYEEDVVRTTEQRTVDLFRNWHLDLYAHGNALQRPD